MSKIKEFALTTMVVILSSYIIIKLTAMCIILGIYGIIIVIK
jgi:hypothetical protein